MSPSDLFDLFLDKDILALIATRFCEYAMAQFGMEHNINFLALQIYGSILLPL
jgi:hypothetical protein